MDPSIMKLLEEDEDESMHSGADVEAFQAQLNRDIGGDASASSSQPSNSDTVASIAVLSQESNQTSSQSFTQWQKASQGQNINPQNLQQNPESAAQQGQHPPESELKQNRSVTENQQHQKQELSGLPVQQKPLQATPQQGQGKAIPQTTALQVSDKISIPLREPNRAPNLESESQYVKLQKMSNQQASGNEQTGNPILRGKQVPFAVLLPTIVPQLDKDRAMQLHTLYAKLKKNEIPKEGFVRHMRDIVGDQMLRLAVSKLQTQMGSNQFPLQPRPPVPHLHPRMPSASTSPAPLTNPQSFAQLQQKGPNSPADTSHIRPSTVQMKTDSSRPTIENNATKSQELDRPSNSHGMQVSQMPPSSTSIVNQEKDRPSIPIQGLNKQQQQHLHFPQSSFPTYGNSGGSYQPYSGTSINTPGQPVRPHLHDSQTRQVMHQQSMSSTLPGGVSQAMNIVNVPKFERQNSITDPNRTHGGSLSQFTNNSTLQQNSVSWQATANKEQSSGPFSSMAYVKQEPLDQGSHGSSAQVEQPNAIPGKFKDETSDRQSSRMGSSLATAMVHPSSVPPSMPTQVDPNVSSSARIPSLSSLAGLNARTPQKKPTSGQKKPLEALGSSPPSKKQKVSGAVLDQSIEQLNDVTAVSGVNLREEEEQLFSGPKEDSRASEASRRIVQEEEERLILQKIPLQKKLAEIMAKRGLKGVSNDVERCLSLCVEERLRGLLSNLIRLSKQRVDAEKARHRTLITSDVRQQIITMNQKAREEWEKKQAEAEKLRKVNEPDGDSGADGDKEKDEGRLKAAKANKEEDDKMRTTAANVAARAAVGGDDMLSKWQLMAEQARQKREGGIDSASGSQAGKDMNLKSMSTSSRNTKDNQEAEKRGNTTSVAASGAVRKFGRSQVNVPQARVARTITVKDVIAVLEREPQMSKSTLIYSLYERVCSDPAAE